MTVDPDWRPNVGTWVSAAGEPPLQVEEVRYDYGVCKLNDGSWVAFSCLMPADNPIPPSDLETVTAERDAALQKLERIQGLRSDAVTGLIAAERELKTLRDAVSGLVCTHGYAPVICSRGCRWFHFKDDQGATEPPAEPEPRVSDPQHEPEAHPNDTGVIRAAEGAVLEPGLYVGEPNHDDYPPFEVTTPLTAEPCDWGSRWCFRLGSQGWVRAVRRVEAKAERR